MKEIAKCESFLSNNGWKKEDWGEDGIVYTKDRMSAVEVLPDEIVLIDDTGDFLHIPVNFYALLGAMLHYDLIRRPYRIYKDTVFI